VPLQYRMNLGVYFLTNKHWGVVMKRLVTFLSFGLCIAGPGHAQTITASLEGVVKDTSGAVIQGARASIAHAGTNAVVNVISGEDGLFRAPALAAGPYTVTLEAPGFKKAQRSGITLQVNQAARIEVVLEVGEVTDTIKVTAQAPLLQATTSAVGHVVDNARIVNLPLNQRNPFALAFLVPGVTGNIGIDASGRNPIMVNGGRGGTTEILVDGIPTAPPLVNAGQGFAALPSVDAVQEFKVETSNFSAEFGRSGSGIINLIYKSGTNELHGSAFEFLRNSALDANNFFANKTGLPLASFKRNQFGGSLGGPVVLPKLYDGRNKTFFFVDYEGFRARSAATQITTVPSAAIRRGDFSQLRDSAGRQIVIYDPATTVRQGAGFVRQAVPGNVIPASQIDPVAARIVPFWALPNRAGDPQTGINNYAASGTNTTDNDSFDVKIDHNLSDRQRFAARYSRRDYATRPPDFVPKEIRLAALPGNILVQPSDSFSFDYHLTASPTYLLNVRLGANRILRQLSQPSQGFDLSKELGFPTYIRDSAEALMFPFTSPAGYVALGHSNGQQARNAFETHSLHVANTKVLTRHQLKFGFEGRVLRVNTNEMGQTVGTYTFGRNFTQGPNPLLASATAGDGFASFLSGLGSGAQTQFFKVLSVQNFYWGFYLADDWKVTPKLTLNLGLRYELETPRTERFNRMNYIDPQAPSPLAGPSGVANLKGGLVFVTEKDRSQFDIDTNNWSPRLGFAYQAASKTVVRGGLGLFYAPSLQAAGGTINGPGFRSDTAWLATLDGVTPNHFLRNPFPNGYIPVSGSSLGLATGVGTSISGPLRRTKTPYVEQLSFGIQQQLPGGVLIEADYLANRGLQLVDGAALAGLPMNQLSPEHLALGSQLLQTVPNPFSGVITTGALAAPTIQRRFLLRPFPQFDGVSALTSSGGTSNYHSFQLKAEKRLSQGFAFLLAYTNAKSIEDASSANSDGWGSVATRQNMYDRRAERAISPNDISQRLVISHVYELPFGAGKAFGKSWNRAVDALLGGWQINGITTFQKGQPLSIDAPNTCNCFNPGLRPNMSGSAKLSGPVKDRLNRYFDTSVFSQPEQFAFGSAPRTLPNVRSPGIQNWDFSVFKNFRFDDRWNLQFRAEAFNLFNTPQFGFPNQNFGDLGRGFGEITSQANSPRQVQFGLKVLF